MLKLDFHTHSIRSGHALNTVYELVGCAKQKGLTHIGITEHGPSMEGAPHEDYFWISDQLTYLNGINVFLGIEANILNENGDIDLRKDLLKKQRIVSAGLHAKTPYKLMKPSLHTESLVNAMENPFVKIITHPYRPEFPVDIEIIVKTSHKTNTLLEINDQLFQRKQFLPELIEKYSMLIRLCKKHDLPVIVGSDAHIAEKIGSMNNILRIKDKIGLSDELIINNKPDALLRYIKNEKCNSL